MKRLINECRKASGFTMIELLVVVVIVGVLAAALTTVVGKFLRAGENAASHNNLMRLGRAVAAYKSDHDGCYPASGGYCTQFIIFDGGKETRYGRASGWVYFSHNCPRARGSAEGGSGSSMVGDGHASRYGWGIDESASGCITGSMVNEEGCCTCFDSKSKEGGISPKPAEWLRRTGSDQWSSAEVSIMNGALFLYMNKDLKAYSNPAFAKRATEKLAAVRSEKQVVRAYAMNVVTGTDSDIYDIPKSHSYAQGGPYSYDGWALRFGQQTLRPYVDSSTRAEAMPARTALFVELDLDDDQVAEDGSLAGDQVWDWDKGDECMGFAHEDNGALYAHVCFADGHVESIRDPSPDMDNPSVARRRKLSKWYGSGGLNAEGEK